MKLSLVIPCIPKHIPALIKTLDYYQQGTQPPDELIISLSGCSELSSEKIKEIQNKYEQCFINFKLILTDQILNRANNRNKGVDHATGDVISFSDADDIPHPQRIEILKYFFEKYQPMMVLHSFFLKNCVGKNSNHCIHCSYRNRFDFQNWGDLSEIKFVPPEQLQNLNYPTTEITPGVKGVIGFIDDRQIYAHHGFVTVNRQVLNQIRFDPTYPRGQDSLFCQQVLKLFNNCLLIEPELMIYNNNWLPSDKSAFYQIDIGGQVIHLDLGSKSPPPPGKPRSTLEIDIISQTITNYFDEK